MGSRSHALTTQAETFSPQNIYCVIGQTIAYKKGCSACDEWQCSNDLPDCGPSGWRTAAVGRHAAFRFGAAGLCPAPAPFAVHRIHHHCRNSHRFPRILGRQHIVSERTGFRSGTASAGRPQPDIHHVPLRQGCGSSLRAGLRKRCAQPPRRGTDGAADVAQCRPYLLHHSGWQHRSSVARPVGRSRQSIAAAGGVGPAAPGRQCARPDRDQQPVSRHRRPAGFLLAQAASGRPAWCRRHEHHLSRLASAGHRVRRSRPCRHGRRQGPGHRASLQGLGGSVARHLRRAGGGGDDAWRDRRWSVLLARVQRQHDRRLRGCSRKPAGA